MLREPHSSRQVITTCSLMSLHISSSSHSFLPTPEIEGVRKEMEIREERRVCSQLIDNNGHWGNFLWKTRNWSVPCISCNTNCMKSINSMNQEMTLKRISIQINRNNTNCMKSITKNEQ